MVLSRWKNNRFCCCSQSLWSSLKLRSVTKSAKPDFISGNEHWLSWSIFQELFHKIFAKISPISFLSELSNLLMKFLTNLVLFTWRWLTFLATVISECSPVRIWEEEVFIIGALDYLSIIVTVIILRQVKVSYPKAWTLHEHLWTIAVCVAFVPNDWVGKLLSVKSNPSVFSFPMFWCWLYYRHMAPLADSCPIEF